MQSKIAESSKVVVLGTGGTIAGISSAATDNARDDLPDNVPNNVPNNVHYRAAQLGVRQLLDAVPALAGQALEAEQVAQLDSKDMDFDVWLALAQRIEFHVARDDVAGVVVTHGTDTLEETAYFLQRVLSPRKPVVMTAAMRPSNAMLRDGPQNLYDAVCVARQAGAFGVVAVLAGAVHGALDMRKLHSYRVDAFGSGDTGVLGWVEEGRLRRLREWPAGAPVGLARLPRDTSAWPLVEMITGHAGMTGALVQAAIAQGVRGLVVAGPGNGSVHERLEAALRIAQQSGVRVWRCTRCLAGPVFDEPELPFPSAGTLTPVQARIELMLNLLVAPG